MSDAGAASRAAEPNPNEAMPSPTIIARHGHEPMIAQPSTFLIPPGQNRTMPEKPLTALDKDQRLGLKSIRDFLKVRTSYDVLPLSFRLIILSTELLVSKSLTILLQNGIVSAPLWDSHTSTFAGLLTTSDYINVIQYYWQNPDALNQIDQFRLSSLREIEKAIGVLPLETLSVNPERPLYEACRQMLKTRARRIPLVDIDDETKRESVVSVITQYRILKFIAVNVNETEMLKKPVSEIGLGTYQNLQTATMDTTVIEVIHSMVKYNISSVPIVDEVGRVLNVFEAVDVIAVIKGGQYDELSTSVGDALSKRSDDFAGIYTCSEDDRLDSIFDTIRKSRVHRLVVIDEDNRLKGVISLSDILQYVLTAAALWWPLRATLSSSVQVPEVPTASPFLTKHNPFWSNYFLVHTDYNMDSHNNENSSSASSSLTGAIINSQQQYFELDATSNDNPAPRGLKQKPRIPRHRKSFVDALTSRFPLGSSQEHDENFDTNSNFKNRFLLQPSNTWTSSSGGATSEDEIEDRTDFVEEYNKIAKKYGLRSLVPEDFRPIDFESVVTTSERQGSWFSRKLFRRSSSTQSITDQESRQKTNNSNLANPWSRKSCEKNYELQELVRICGSSIVYLSSEYAASSLTLPTCLRATAQYLIQHAPKTRGIFRIPGAQSTINSLYKHYYALDENGAVISTTVRSPTLPEHIKYSVHDVASTFKKFLSGLTGGILGSLHLYDALVSIHSHLQGAPEETRTRQSKVRSRLIALAITSERSQFRRDLICAVFGLLSMIGRAAETAPREDDNGRPLPTSDLMGYGALGIVFGPLLVGDLLDSSMMVLAEPRGGLIVVPVNQTKSRKERFRGSKSSGDHVAMCTNFQKVKIANSIAEMLITHWRDVVRHMKDLKGIRQVGDFGILETKAHLQRTLRPSASDLVLRKQRDWNVAGSSFRNEEKSMSPSSDSADISNLHGALDQEYDLKVRKQRSRRRLGSRNTYSDASAISILSPTAEEPSTLDLGCSPRNIDKEDSDITAPGKMLDGAYERCQQDFSTTKDIQSNLPCKSDRIAQSKDPLAKVSHDEDIASLATLSQAIDLLDQCLEPNSEHINAESTPLHTRKQDTTDESLLKRAVYTPTKSPLSKYNSSTTKTEVSQRLDRKIPRTGTVKALAARLNTVQFKSKPVSPCFQSTKKSLPSDIRERIDSPNRDILATYTTNTSISPAKSQLSKHSDISACSTWNKTPVNRSPARQQKDSTPKASTPKLPSRSPLESLTPLRSLHNNIPPANNLSSGKSIKSIWHDKNSIHTVDYCPVNDLSLTTDGTFDSVDSYDPSSETYNSCSADIVYNPSALPGVSCIDPFISRVPNPLASPGSKSTNSILHSQVRILQQQLYQKTEEVLYLNRQMNSDSRIDVERMSQELEQVRMELESWKLKAEVAETKLGTLERLVNGGNYISESPYISPATPSRSGVNGRFPIMFSEVSG
ncbi:hypothetical protein B7463_g12005, partial [Scytalidium lignicola]